ncbi:MAG TPA: hemerythrin domain-containing protein, partial [Ktedonobacterales bacterium]|nr:hemerythrin domain-containing protein [Ktedonobacterales bacterium]
QAALTGDRARALQLAGVLMEHWQTRTLRHAEAEEQGWYRDVAHERPELRMDIAQLTRDHDLLRELLSEIEQIIAVRGWVTGIVERFEAMMLLNAIHSRDEERRLLGGTEDAQSEQMPGSLLSSEADEDTPARAHDDAGVVDVPLAVAYPELYRRGTERLSARGIHPGDLRLTIHRERNGESMQLCAAFGHNFAESLDIPLPDAADYAAVEQTFDTIADACGRAVRSEYYEAMQLTEPGAPGGQGSKRARFSLTVLNQPKDQAK